MRSCVKARLLPLRSSRAALRFAALTPAHYDWLRGVRTENTNCSDQPLIGQGSVAHDLAHPLLRHRGHGKPSHPCVSLQHTALRKTPRKNTVSLGLSRFAREGGHAASRALALHAPARQTRRGPPHGHHGIKKRLARVQALLPSQRAPQWLNGSSINPLTLEGSPACPRQYHIRFPPHKPTRLRN